MDLQISQPFISNPVDEETIRTLFEQLMDCWNRGNGNAYATLFEEDANYVAFKPWSPRNVMANGTLQHFTITGFAL